MLTSKGLGPYSGEGTLAEGTGRYRKQDEARCIAGGNDNSRTATEFA